MAKVLNLTLLLLLVGSTVNAQVKVDSKIRRKFYQVLHTIPSKSNLFRGYNSNALFTIMRTDTLNKSDYWDNGIQIMDIDSARRLSTPKMADENVMPFPLSVSIKSYLFKDRLYIYTPLIVDGFISELKQNKISTSFYDSYNIMHQPLWSRKMLISTESKCTITTVNFKAKQVIYGSIYIKTKPQLTESPYFKSGFIKQCLTFKYYFKIKPVLVYKKPGLHSFI